MKIVYRILFILHLLMGIGGAAGGMAAIINPLSPLGAPVEILKNSPFNDFLIPGIILFAVIGLGNLFSSLMILLKSELQGYISSIFTWALPIWIIVQCIMINAVAAPHIIVFLIGIIGAALSAAILFKKNQFPANIIVQIVSRVIKNT